MTNSVIKIILLQSDDEISYKKKYLTMMSAMKQLQNTFLRAQQNAERNVKGKRTNLKLKQACLVTTSN